MRSQYNFNFIWECNSCCHVTVLEPNSAATLLVETVPLVRLEMGKKGFCTWINTTLVRRKELLNLLLLSLKPKGTLVPRHMILPLGKVESDKSKS